MIIYIHTHTHIYVCVCIVFYLIYYDDVKIIINDHRPLTPAFHRLHIILCILKILTFLPDRLNIKEVYK